MAASEHSGGPGDPEISVVVPVYNEADNVGPLVAEIDRAMAAMDGITGYEIIFVDDCSRDATPSRLGELAGQYGCLRVIRHQTRGGQSAAIHAGVRAAAAPLIVTLDGDGQNDPADIAKLLAARQGAPAGSAGLMVAGRRVRRRDGLVKRASSRIANRVRSALLGDATQDTGCGLKAFGRADFLALPRFDHMHRFLPALILRDGGRVISVDVAHRPRARGASKYGLWGRLGAGIVDLLGVLWLKRRATSPETEEVTDQDGGPV